MKKEIPAGLIAIVVIAAIAIFVVTPSMSTSFEIDGKLTSDELELLFLGSGNDEYQEDKCVSEKIGKSRISASAGGAEVYEAGLLPEFLEKWIDKLFEFLSGTDPKELGEDLYDLVDEEYPHYDEAGESGPPLVAGEVIGEYVGPKEIILDGELSEDEQSMLKAMGVREIVYNEAERGDYSTGIRSVKSSHIAFLKGPDGQYNLYYHEELDPSSNEIRTLTIGSPSGYPIIVVSVNTGRCGVLKDKPTHRAGIDNLPENLKREIKYAFSEDGLGLECVIEDMSPKDVKKYIGEDDIFLESKGGTASLNIEDIPVIDGVEFR